MSDATDLTSQSDVNHRTDTGGRSELREPTNVHRTKIPGFSVNVLVTKDIVLPPYRQPGVLR